MMPDYTNLKSISDEALYELVMAITQKYPYILNEEGICISGLGETDTTIFATLAGGNANDPKQVVIEKVEVGPSCPAKTHVPVRIHGRAVVFNDKGCKEVNPGSNIGFLRAGCMLPRRMFTVVWVASNAVEIIVPYTATINGEILHMKVLVFIAYQGEDLRSAAFVADSGLAIHETDRDTGVRTDTVTNATLSDFFKTVVAGVVRDSGLLDGGEIKADCKKIAETLNNCLLFTDRGMVVKQVVPFIPLTADQAREVKRRQHYGKLADNELDRQIRADAEADAKMENESYALQEVD